jgi:hypothetical protein
MEKYMNPELEKIVDSVLANGELTDRSRELLMKKAEQLGVDLIDFELELENKIAQKKSATPKSNKEGSLKKCPACGAPVQSFNTKCPECGHEFKNTEANIGIKQLEEKLNKIRDVDDLYYDEKVAKIIKNHPIPNTKEDLYEMLTYMSSKVLSSGAHDGGEINNAYHSRALEVINKLIFMSDVEPQIIKRAEEIKTEMTKHKEKNSIKSTIIAIVAFAAGTGMIYGMYLIVKSFL